MYWYCCCDSRWQYGFFIHLLCLNVAYIIHSGTYLCSYSVYFGTYSNIKGYFNHSDYLAFSKDGVCFCFTIMAEYSFSDLDQK
jgi:hypothetical protein